jgi:uncharacterized protein YqjF (DUF2071 family)
VHTVAPTTATATDPVAGRPVLLTQRWADIVWVHWQVPAEVVRPLVPAALAIDTFAGGAWVGLVPFEMRDLRVVVGGRRLPAIGSTGSFSEINVRTYVTGPAGPGVWFHSLDATSRLAVAVARVAWALPYRTATVAADHAGAARSWDVRRRDGATGALAVTVGEAVTADPLDDFLTARFRLYAPLGRRRLVTAPVRHRAWPLRRAGVDRLDPGLVTAAGYPAPGRPDHVLAADAVDVAVGRPQLLRS